jgi:hypothetical protein
MILSSGREELRAIPTFSEFVRDLYVPFAMNAKRSWRTDETVLRIQVLPTISHLPLDQVTTAIIADLLSRMVRKRVCRGNHEPGSGSASVVHVQLGQQVEGTWCS